MPRQQVTNETAIQYLRSNREFMEAYESRQGRKDFKPLEQYSRPELLRRYRGVLRAEATGQPVSITELRRGKAKTPEHPLRVRHIKKHKGVADQYQIGSKQRQPQMEHLQRLRTKTQGNSQGDIVIVFHGLMLYEVAGGEECVERTASFKVNVEDADMAIEHVHGDLYEFAYELDTKGRRWCEIWEISILPAFERKIA